MGRPAHPDEQAWLTRWRASGLSCKRFAREHGLSPSTLYRWSQRRDDGGEGMPAFAEVRIVGALGGAVLEVQHPSGCVVRVTGAVDEVQLMAVLRVLASC